MADKIQFTLNGKNVTANADETIWQAAKRLGEEIPHLCYKDAPDTVPTVTAVRVWWKSTANAPWRLAVSQASAGHGCEHGHRACQEKPRARI